MKLATRHLALFAAPAIPIAALGMPLVVYLPPFYAEDLGLGLSIVGTVFMVTRLWDVLTDVLLGVVTDRVRTRWGRRRPWIVASVPILLLSVWRLFLPETGVDWIYLLVWLVVLYVGWTMLTISHMSWGAELSDDYHVRSRLQAWRQGGLLTGMVLVLALPAWIEQRVGGGGFTRSAAIGWFILALLPLTVAMATLGVRERPVRDTGESVGMLAAFKLAVTNRYMVRVLIADLCAGIAPGVTASLYIFFVEHALRLGEWTSLFLLTYFISGLVSVPIWLRISYRLGKHRTFSIAMLYMAGVLPFVLLLGPDDLVMVVVAYVIYGLGYGAAPVLLRSIVADVTDDDALRSGTQRTGLFYSLLTLTNKLGFAIAVGVAYPLLDLAGFDPQIENTADAIAGLKAVYVIVPVVCFVIAALTMWRFPLDESQQRILRSRQSAPEPPPAEA
ncbi:MAG: MFS transporter [Sandaracinaceae bacterium]|nr:MFS transporter [Sandaracinaceae bacterium]